MTTMNTENHINYQRIEQAIVYLEQNFKLQPDLDEVAEKVHLSPFHFQRLFTEWAGISPKKFLQYLTVDFLKQKLSEVKNLTDAADAAGLSSQSRVYDLFTTIEGVTPQEYKTKGEGVIVQYGFYESPFGLCLIGATEKGICWLSFLNADDKFRAVEEMKRCWYKSIFHEDKSHVATLATRIFARDRKLNRIHLMVKGTNFQLKVWEALLRIPSGDVTTYQNIATSIANPNALQAVGSAVGSNHIAYLIPCHRVIRKDGILGEYRWSPSRKKSLIGWEISQRAINSAS